MSKGVFGLRRNKPSFDNIESILSPGMEINGSLSSQGSVRIDGKVEGKVNIKGDLIIGEQGRVKGEVKAANLKLAGRIEGNAIISGRFDLSASGVMAGDVQCAVFTIDEGGQLNGNTSMGRADQQPSSGRNRFSEAGEKQKAGR
jgi:cytoskeletal protein CcmA (bactofilin family)